MNQPTSRTHLIVEMPTESDYRDQWRENHRLLAHLDAQRIHPDWTVTVAFYTALHSIQRFLARKGETVNTHRQRERAMFRYQQDLTRSILRQYSDMENLSRDARYDCYDPLPAEVQDQIRKLRVIDSHIATLLR